MQNLAHGRRVTVLVWVLLFTGTHNLSEALFGFGEFDEAAKDLERAAELKPDSPDAYPFLAKIYERRGGTSQAIGAREREVGVFEDLLSSTPEDEALKKGFLEAIEALVELCEQAQKPELVRKYNEKRLSVLVPSSP